MDTRFLSAATYALLAFAVLGTTTAPAAKADFRYDAANVDVAAHWAARATLANAMMFSGLGEPLVITLGARDAILKHAGYVARPEMPKLPLVGTIYAAGEPRFAVKADFAKPETLKWVPGRADRTIEPAAQAWALAMIASPEFHLSYHEDRSEKRVGLMMAPQAQAQAKALGQLVNPQGLFAPRRPDGAFGAPRPADQSAVLWGVSNLILAATSKRDDYWHRAYREMIDPSDWRLLADAALAAIEKLPPASAADRALAVEALGRYALATTDAGRRAQALAAARRHADALVKFDAGTLAELGLSVYGLVEAGRLFEERSYAEAAAKIFRGRLLPLWDDRLGAFRPKADAIAYTPRTLGALAAGLNALRWHGAADVAGEANRLYPRLFETVLIRAGMLLSSPLPLVSGAYLEKEPSAHFAHPELPLPTATGTAPVFAAEVRYEGDRWKATDRTFRTAEAMFLANMLATRREGFTDVLLPPDRLAALKR